MFFPYSGFHMEYIRQNWLISFNIICLTSWIYLLFFTPSLFAIIMLTIGAGFGGVTYYFGYKKRGTAWLSWILVIRAISLIITFCQIIYLIFSHKLNTYLITLASVTGKSAWTVEALWLFGIAMSIYYWVWSFQLRKVNKLSKEKDN
ncbi:MAG: hypothetical protein KR126chlam5_00882 [Candidatus Anoxychlamydiales bacterium]|nr:hypothetical protein [Candidatus Anoxychlamydiales bacterium]NGX52579.1 hypothetical protein [Candidatus Anoxychlamydiales bacterium]